MPDKIRPGGLDRYAPLSGTSRTRAGSTQASASTTASPRAAGDSLNLTGDAALLQSAHAAARSASGVDSARVSEVRQQLRDGRYSIDPQMIASKLLKTEWELAGT